MSTELQWVIGLAATFAIGHITWAARVEWRLSRLCERLYSFTSYPLSADDLKARIMSEVEERLQEVNASTQARLERKIDELARAVEKLAIAVASGRRNESTD